MGRMIPPLEVRANGSEPKSLKTLRKDLGHFHHSRAGPTRIVPCFNIAACTPAGGSNLLELASPGFCSGSTSETSQRRRNFDLELWMTETGVCMYNEKRKLIGDSRRVSAQAPITPAARRP
jgi:hypothetical protein